MTLAEAVQILLDYATGKAWHRYDGAVALCPDGIDHATRDPECVVCQAIGVVEQPDRGVLINRKATAGAALVKAREALGRAKKPDRATAQAAVVRAEAELAAATEALDSVGGP
jgi:hypothetical protein